jgi:hypothetical protein
MLMIFLVATVLYDPSSQTCNTGDTFTGYDASEYCS